MTRPGKMTSTLDTTRLQYFCAVVRTGSLRKAAEILHISPAALSKAIHVLEDEVKQQLIVPSGRGISVTDEGTKLAKSAESILESLDRLALEMRRGNSPESPEIKVASFEVFTTWLMGPLMEHFPKSRLILHELIPGEMEIAISNRAVDYGITYIPIPQPDLDLLKVGSLEMGVYGRKDVFDNTPFEQLPFAIPIIPLQGSPNKVKGLDGWPDDKLQRNVVFRVSLMESALELCRRGKAVAFLPEPVVAAHNEAVKPKASLSKLKEPHGLGAARRQDVYLIKRKSDVENAMVRKLAAGLRMLCRS